MQKQTLHAKSAAALKVSLAEALAEYFIKSPKVPAANQVGMEFRYDLGFSPRMSELMLSMFNVSPDIYFK